MGNVLAFLHELAALFDAIRCCLDQLRQWTQPNEPTEAETKLDETDATHGPLLGDDFLYDCVARVNETIVANIDTADLALLAVVGGALAVVVFGIDKIRELAPPWEAWAYCLLGGAVAVCTSSYLIGFGQQREALEPGSFVAAFSDEPDETISTAILDAVLVCRTNARVRLLKRVGVVVSLLFLIAGTVVAALARSFGPVV